MIRTVTFVALLGLAVAAAPAVRAGDKAMSTEAFLAKVIDCNVTEKDLAEKAIKNAQSEDVRKYAQHLLSDHEKMNRQALDMARDLKIGVVTGTSADHKKALADLLTKSGKDFDRAYVRHMVKSHEEAIKMFQNQAKNASQQTVRAFATQGLPMLREHLEQARKLDAQLNP